MSESWHGTLGGYANHNCRCDQCKGASREYHRARRVPCISCGAPIYRRAHGTERYCRKCFAQSHTIPLSERHGTVTGYSKGCRCDECRRASVEDRKERRWRDVEKTRAYYREYYRRRRAKLKSEGPDSK